KTALKTEADVVVNIGFGRVIEFHGPGAVAGEAGGVIAGPVFVLVWAESFGHDDGVSGLVGDEFAGEGDDVVGLAVAGVVVDELDTGLEYAVAVGAGKDGVLPEHRCGGFGEIDVVGVRIFLFGIDIHVRAHEGIAEVEWNVGAGMRQAEGVAEFVDGALQEILGIETFVEAEVRTDFAGNGVVVDHRPAATARIAGTAPVTKSGGTIAEVDEEPPDMTFASDFISPARPIDNVTGITRIPILAAGKREFAFDPQHLDRTVRFATENIGGRGRIAPLFHAGKKKSFGGVGDLCKSLVGAIRNFEIGRRKHHDAHRRRWRLVTDIGEGMAIG